MYIERNYDAYAEEGEDDPDILIEIKKLWYASRSFSQDRKNGIQRDLRKLFWLNRIYPNSEAIMMIFASTEAVNQIEDYTRVMHVFENRYKTIQVLWNKKLWDTNYGVDKLVIRLYQLGGA